MRKILCLSVMILCLGIVPALAQKKDTATHIWIDAGSASTMVNVNTVQLCEQMVRQVAKIEGSGEGHCYNSATLLKIIDCKLITRGKSKYDPSGTIECTSQ